MKKCYLCGSTDELTQDHVPPKNLFRKPRPANLITVACCRKCNESFAKDDEAFRAFVSAYIGRSKDGGWIWRNKVMGSTFQRSVKLKEQFRRDLREVAVDNRTGTVIKAVQFSSERVQSYLTRVTKGLMTVLYPDLDYSNSVFTITLLEMDDFLLDLLSKLKGDERGDGTFRFWMGFARDLGEGDNPSESLWFYQFYNGLIFMVDVE